MGLSLWVLFNGYFLEGRWDGWVDIFYFLFLFFALCICGDDDDDNGSFVMMGFGGVRWVVMS